MIDFSVEKLMLLDCIDPSITDRQTDAVPSSICGQNASILDVE